MVDWRRPSTRCRSSSWPIAFASFRCSLRSRLTSCSGLRRLAKKIAIQRAGISVTRARPRPTCCSCSRAARNGRRPFARWRNPAASGHRLRGRAARNGASQHGARDRAHRLLSNRRRRLHDDGVGQRAARAESVRPAARERSSASPLCAAAARAGGPRVAGSRARGAAAASGSAAVARISDTTARADGSRAGSAVEGGPSCSTSARHRPCIRSFRARSSSNTQPNEPGGRARWCHDRGGRHAGRNHVGMAGDGDARTAGHCGSIVTSCSRCSPTTLI